MMLQAVEDSSFQMVAADGVLVRTGALIARVGAADPDLILDDSASATFAALHQAGEEMFGPTSITPIAVRGFL